PVRGLAEPAAAETPRELRQVPFVLEGCGDRGLAKPVPVVAVGQVDLSDLAVEGLDPGHRLGAGKLEEPLCVFAVELSGPGLDQGRAGDAIPGDGFPPGAHPGLDAGIAELDVHHKRAELQVKGGVHWARL